MLPCPQSQELAERLGLEHDSEFYHDVKVKLMHASVSHY